MRTDAIDAQSRAGGLRLLATIVVAALALTLLQVMAPSKAWAGNYTYKLCQPAYEPASNCSTDFANPTAVAVDAAGNVYTAGQFNLVGTAQKKGIAKFDSSGTLIESFDGDLTGGINITNVGTVESLLVTATHVYVAGGFGASGGPTPYLVALDPTTGAVKSDFKLTLTEQTGLASTLALDAATNTLYVGGAFNEIYYNGAPTGRARLIAVDATTGEPKPWNPQPDGTVNSIALQGSTLFIGGRFTMVGNGAPEMRMRLAAVRTDDLGTVTSWNPTDGSFAGNVQGVQRIALSGDGSKLYFGGGFTQVGGVSRSRLAAATTDTGTITSWDPSLLMSTSPNSTRVTGISVANGYVVVGGNFNTVGGSTTRQGVAAWRDSDGALLNWTANLGTDSFGNPVFASGIGVTVAGAKNSTVYVMGNTTARTGSLNSPLMLPDSAGQINPYAGPGTLPPQASSVSRSGATLSWTNPWVGGQSRAVVMYKRSSAPNLPRNWYIFARTSSAPANGQPAASISLSAGSCPVGWTCPRTLAYTPGTSYDFDVVMTSWDTLNSPGPFSVETSYTP